MNIPTGLHRCDQCGELRGRTRSNGSSRGETTTFVSCLCSGIVCRYCRTRAIHRPISTYYDEETQSIRHVPQSARLAPCPDCAALSAG